MLGATVFSLASPLAIAHAVAFALDLGLKSLVLCAAALAIDRVFVRRVHGRSAALHACLVGLALLPAAALLFPEMRLNLGRNQESGKSSPFAPRKGVISRSETRQGVERRADEVEALQANGESNANASEKRLAGMEPASPPLAARREQQGREAAATAARAVNWPALALLLYALVALGGLLRLSMSLAAVGRLKRSGSPLTEAAWTERLARWRKELGIARSVQLLKSDRIDVPVVIGWRRPAILAPERLAAASATTIDAVLLHELAHVRRGDYGWNLLLRLVQTFYWPNPLVWLVGRALSRVREQACDDACIHWLGGAESYRAILLELAAGLLRRPLAALGMAMARTSRLQRRFEQIDASLGRAECQSRWRSRFAAIAIAVSVAGALGALKIVNGVAAEPPARVRVTIDKDRQKTAAPRTATEEPIGEEKPADEPAGPIKIHVEKVRREDFVVQTTQPGTLTSSRSTELHARVAGLIVARHVSVGDLVKTGQVLAEIDAPELDAEIEEAKTRAEAAPIAVDQAKGKLDEALARLEGARADVDKCDADRRQASSQSEDAEKAYKGLIAADKKAISSRVLKEAESQARTARGAVNVAEAQLAAAQARIKQAEATVVVAKAGLRIAQLDGAAALQRSKRLTQRAEFRKIAAPADGIVTREAAEPGSLAKLGGGPLFVISSTDRVTMETEIPERDALRVVPGQHCQVWLDSERDGKPHDAKVGRVGYVIDPQTRTLPVEIDLDNPGDRLRPGMFGKVTIDLETHPGALTAPKSMLYSTDDDGAFYCFRAIDGRAVQTTFSANGTNGDGGDRIEVNSGLSEGDLVVTEAFPLKDKAWAWHLKRSRVEIVDKQE